LQSNLFYTGGVSNFRVPELRPSLRPTTLSDVEEAELSEVLKNMTNNSVYIFTGSGQRDCIQQLRDEWHRSQI